jgi:hypothetical protein
VKNQFGNGTPVRAEYSGEVLVLYNGEHVLKKGGILLQLVHFVPKAMYNLMSIGAAVSHNASCMVNFLNNMCSIRLDEMLVLRAHKLNSTYQIPPVMGDPCHGSF